MDYVALSKTLSYALRHNPYEFDIELDQEGWVDLVSLLNSLRKIKSYENVTAEDIQKIIKDSSKTRFDLDTSNNRIRAFYGHSVEDRIVKEMTAPPGTLYHGTDPLTAQIILKQGLKPMTRQYVHLSTDHRTAMVTGRRKCMSPLILTIHSKDAHARGIKFYIGNQDVWLSDFIPPEYISF